ncbi:MAG: hypothetical protein QHC89_22585, partial [Bosea sp. (in: a-proteobacteria)]|nr:hypothetical protein [Bosea sp. (in: a-proteobacteria)]
MLAALGSVAATRTSLVVPRRLRGGTPSARRVRLGLVFLQRVARRVARATLGPVTAPAAPPTTAPTGPATTAPVPAPTA